MDDLTLGVLVGLALLYLSQSQQQPAAQPRTQPIPTGYPSGALTPPPYIQPPIAQPIATTVTQTPAGTGSGSGPDDPFVAMSLDPAQLAADVSASLRAIEQIYGVSIPDDAYWIDHENHAGQFSNGVWYAGHNAYWESRMDPNNQGSSDPNLAYQPAQYRA